MTPYHKGIWNHIPLVVVEKMYEVTGAHLESRARKHCMLYVKSTGEEELRTKRQMYLHFLEDEYQLMMQYKTQSKQKFQFRKSNSFNPSMHVKWKSYPSLRRFNQIISECQMSIKIPKKEWCDVCTLIIWFREFY